MWPEELSLKIFELLDDRDLWYRVVALDLETKMLEQKYLVGERILGVSFARRQSSGKLENKYFILEGDSDEKEADLLHKLNSCMLEWKPIVIVGYGCRGYDLPLLAIKKDYFYRKDTEFWGISNILIGSTHIELGELSRYIFHKQYKEDRTIRDMIFSMKHKHFKDLPFKSTKDIYDSDKEQKGKWIYEDWKSKDGKFEKYLEGEAHDQLLIAERIRDTEF